VESDGEIIVVGSRDPEHDAARALLAKGITGKLTFVDAHTGRPRTVIDIDQAAKLTVEENSGYGPRVRKWKPMPDKARQLCDGSPPTAEDDLVFPTLPPEANEAA
jgi:hypothetical protein